MTTIKQFKQAEKLIKDIEKKIYNWNERSMFTIKGVKNLSRADLDVIDMYAKSYIQSGDWSRLMEPRGTIEQVLQKYELI